MILVDTNIFLEILLEQDGKEKCKQFLANNIENICLSDFSLHSIGIILFQKNKHQLFDDFMEDVLPKIPLLSSTISNYKNLKVASIANKLDFDDTYQFCIANENEYDIATMDKDFMKVSSLIKIHFV